MQRASCVIESADRLISTWLSATNHNTITKGVTMSLQRKSVKKVVLAYSGGLDTSVHRAVAGRELRL